MVLKRNLLGWRFEEYWFDEPGYLASTADIAALRTLGGSSPCHCRIPERTLVVPLDRPEADIVSAFAARAKTSIRQARKSVRVDRAVTEAERMLFYEAYIPFAQEKGLLIPDPAEEGDLEIFLARNPQGELLQAAAFLPASGERVYRYRYGVYVRKSQSNAILVHTALQRAKETGFLHFDLGGVTPGAKPGSPEAGINFFKSQFGGMDTRCHLYIRGTRWSTRLLFKFLQATGLAAHHHAIASVAGRLAHR